MKPYSHSIKNKLKQKRKFKRQVETYKYVDKSSARYRHDVYFNGTEKEKEETFAHFSTQGYAWFGMFIMLVALLTGIYIRGFIGFIISTFLLCWVIYKFTNLMFCWELVEKHNPDMKKYRIDK